MTNPFVINSVGDTVVTYLHDIYPETLQGEHACEFRLFSSGEFAETVVTSTAVTLYLYNVTKDPAFKNPPDRGRGNTPLPDPFLLRYLLTIWADNALTENMLTAWVIAQLEKHPIFEQTHSLSSDNPDDYDTFSFQLLNMPNKEMMQLWDGVASAYRMSLVYEARVSLLF